MQRSTKASWLDSPGDLREADVPDVPVPGESVRVRALSAKYSADVQAQLKLVQQGREQVAKIDVAEMELLQFHHGCIEPEFTLDEARAIQQRFGPAFKAVIAKIDEISGVDKKALEEAEERFPVGGTSTGRTVVADGHAARNNGPDLPVPAGGAFEDDRR